MKSYAMAINFGHFHFSAVGEDVIWRRMLTIGMRNRGDGKLEPHVPADKVTTAGRDDQPVEEGMNSKGCDETWKGRGGTAKDVMRPGRGGEGRQRM